MNYIVWTLCVVLAFVTMLAGCSADTTEAEYISNAKQYMDKKEFQAASIELKNALLKNPASGNMRLLLGQVYLKTENPSGAEKEFNRAAELGMAEYLYNADLAKAMLQQGKIEALLQLKVDGNFSDNNSSDLHAARGYAFLALSKLEASLLEFEKAQRLNPTSVFAMVGMAGYLARNGQLDRAYEQLDAAIVIDSSYHQAWMYKGSLQKHEGKLEQAIESYNMAVKVGRSKGKAILKRVMLFVQAGEFELAQKDLDSLKEQYKQSPEVNYAQALLYYKKQEFRESQIFLEHVLSVQDQHPQALFLLGQVHYIQRNLNLAEQAVTVLVKNQPKWIPGVKLLAMIQIQQKRNKEAVELLEEVVLATPADVLSRNLLADALLSLGRDDEALLHLENVVVMQPKSAEYRARLGAGLLQVGEKETGLAELRKAMRLDPSLHVADMVLIRSFLEAGAYDDALKAAKGFVKKQPKLAMPHKLLGMVFAGKGDVKNATAEFEAARAISRGDVYANQNLASIALTKNQPEKAKEFLLEILEVNPAHLGSILKLAAVEGQLKNYKAKRILLINASEKSPSALTPKLELVRDYIREGNLASARRELGSIDGRYNNIAELKLTSGQLYLLEGQASKAKQVFEQLLDRSPKSVDLNFLLAQSFALLKNRTMYRKYIERVLQLKPDHLAATGALVELLLQNKNFSSARESLDALKSISSENNATYLKLEALYAVKSGDNQSALEYYKRLHEQLNSPQSLVTLTRFQWLMGDRPGSLSNLQEWDKVHPRQLGVMLELANAYIEMGSKGEAISMYQKVLEISPKSVIALNNLAWNFRETNPSKALGYANQAYQIYPKMPPVIDSLGMLLFDSGEVERARRLIDEALIIDPDNPTYLYHQALMLKSEGQLSQALKILNRVMESKREFGDKEQVEEMIRQLNLK